MRQKATDPEKSDDPEAGLVLREVLDLITI